MSLITISNIQKVVHEEITPVHTLKKVVPENQFAGVWEIALSYLEMHTKSFHLTWEAVC